jgi:dihydropteroate synthase
MLSYPPIATSHGTLTWDRPHIMAIINVTPDSFSGDGLGADLEATAERVRMAEVAGASIIDLGAESTRPGHQPVSAQEELDRLLPALAAIRAVTALPISIDTTKAAVAEAALAHGADIINDIRGFTTDPDMSSVAATTGAPVILMHDVTPESDRDFVGSIMDELGRRMDVAVRDGVAHDNIILDPGFGFGKSWHQNLELLKRLDELHALNRPLLVGLSRKRTIGWVLGTPESERLEGTIATTVMAIERGAHIVRVHDVLPNVRAALMTQAVIGPPPAEPCPVVEPPA